MTGVNRRQDAVEEARNHLLAQKKMSFIKTPISLGEVGKKLRRKKMAEEKRFDDLFDSICDTIKSGGNAGRAIHEISLLASGKKVEEIDLPQPIMWPTPISCLKSKYPYAEKLIDHHRDAMVKILDGAQIVAKILADNSKTSEIELFKLIKKSCKEKDLEPPTWELVVDETGNPVIKVKKYHDFNVDMDAGAYIFGSAKYYTTLLDTPYTAPAIASIEAGSKIEALKYLDQVCGNNPELAEDLIGLNTHLRGLYFSFKYLLNGTNFCCGMLSPEDATVPQKPEERAVHLMKIILVGNYLQGDTSDINCLLQKVLPKCSEGISPGFVSEVFGIGFATDYANLSPEQYWKIIHWENEKYFLPRIMVKKIFNI